MSTTMLKKENVERKWYVIDAEGKTLGKVAVLAATILNGKHRPEYTPHIDCGECVIIVNAAKAVLTGNKLDKKVYYRHSGYIGGLKPNTAPLWLPSPNWLWNSPSRVCFPRTR